MTEKRNVRVLVLEDSPERIKRFKAYFGVNDHFVFEADFTDDADQAIALFQQKPYDLLFLDHDLGEGSNPDPENNGKRFTASLIGNPRAIHVAMAVVHSINPMGNPAMCDDLKNAGVWCYGIPWVWERLDTITGRLARQINVNAVPMQRREKRDDL